MKTKLTSFFVLHVLLACVFTSTAFAQNETTADAVMTEESNTPALETPVDPNAATADETIMATEEAGVPADSSLPPFEDDAANAATAAEASTAEHSQYGLGALWEQGDVIARGTLIIMIIMSAATWYVLVTKLIEQQGLLSQAKATRKFWQGKDLSEGINTYKQGSAFRSVAEDGINALKQHNTRQGEKVGLAEWLALQLQRSVERVSGELQTGLSLLATVGSCSPFVGLFGTVWGIYHALIAIGLAGQASIDKVAGPVGEALIMTAIGLAVAVPAVLGYNWLVRRNKVIVDSLRNFAADMHANLAMGVRNSN